MPLTDSHNITEVQCKRVVFVHSNLTKYGTFNGAHFLSFCSCGFIKLWNMYIRRTLYVLSGSNTRRRTYVPKEWKNEQVWLFFGCWSADSQTDTGRHQLYNNGSLVLFSTACTYLFQRRGGAALIPAARSSTWAPRWAAPSAPCPDAPRSSSKRKVGTEMSPRVFPNSCYLLTWVQIRDCTNRAWARSGPSPPRAWARGPFTHEPWEPIFPFKITQIWAKSINIWPRYDPKC